MARRLALAPHAVADLDSMQAYITKAGRPLAAERYVADLLDRCRSLAANPHLGREHPDVAAGLMTYPHRGRATIIYLVPPDRVRILRVLGRGRDVNSALDALV